MNGMSTFLSIPRLSKTRKRFALGYLLFILLSSRPYTSPGQNYPKPPLVPGTTSNDGSAPPPPDWK